jgi:hypothetical protein
MNNRPCILASLQPIAPHSDLGRWIFSHDDWEFDFEEAIADFAYKLRMVNN